MKDCCIICGAHLTLLDTRHQRGYCPDCKRHVTAVTEAEWLATSGERVQEALASPAVIYCPHCGAANSPSARRCSKCGKPL